MAHFRYIYSHLLSLNSVRTVIFRSLRRPPTDSNKSGLTKKLQPSDKSNSLLSEFTKVDTPAPARFIKVPDRPTPTGTEAVETWNSPLVSDPALNVRSKREKYEERFAFAESINAELEEAANNANQVLEVIHKSGNQFDNMNAYNALGYLHASLKSKTHSSEMALGRESLLSDTRFLELCNHLYKKSRSYPPNACIGNAIRLTELGIPFRTPIVYVFLSLLKNSINDLTTTDALTLAKCLSPFTSLQLPTALIAGLQVLIQKQADDDFDNFIAQLGDRNAYYDELNLHILLQLFGERLTPTVRKRLLMYVLNTFVEPGSLSGSDMIKFLALLSREWVSKQYIDKCFSRLENIDAIFVEQAIDVASLCMRFRRMQDHILLKKLAEMVTGKLLENSADSSILEGSRMFLLQLGRLNFAAPSLFHSLLKHDADSLSIRNIGLTEFLGAVAVHLTEHMASMAQIINSAKVNECIHDTATDASDDRGEKWRTLDSKAKLILFYLNSFCNVPIPNVPSSFPSCFDEVEEMLVNVTNDAILDVTERLETLRHFLAISKLCGLQVGDQDLAVRLFIPAIVPNSPDLQKLYFVPVGVSDVYQNRFDLMWSCRLRFLVLEKFLSGSDTISIVPISLVRFRSLCSDRERYAYVKDCIANKGDRELLQLLRL